MAIYSPSEWSSYWNDPSDAGEVQTMFHCPACDTVDDIALVYVDRDGRCTTTCEFCEEYHEWWAD
jgi:hypothetical protein